MNLRKTLSILATTLMAVLAFSPLTTHAHELAVQNIRIHTEVDGEAFTDACYEIVDYTSTPHCDNDADGVIEFHDVPIGEYNLVQTADLGGLHPIGEPGVDLSNLTVHNEDINDYRVTLIDAGESTDIGLITRDPETGDVIEGGCYELLEYSNVGCDEDGNGIVTFEAIPWGTYTIHQTETPEGYEPMGDYEINLQPLEASGSGPVIIPLLQAETQGGETSTNISVLVVNAETGERVASEESCLQFPGMSNPGCDEAVTDGQIDFMGIDPTFGQPTFDIHSLACGYDASDANDVIMHSYGEHHTTLILNVTPNGENCA